MQKLEKGQPGSGPGPETNQCGKASPEGQILTSYCCWQNCSLVSGLCILLNHFNLSNIPGGFVWLHVRCSIRTVLLTPKSHFCNEDTFSFSLSPSEFPAFTSHLISTLTCTPAPHSNIRPHLDLINLSVYL